MSLNTTSKEESLDGNKVCWSAKHFQKKNNWKSRSQLCHSKQEKELILKKNSISNHAYWCSYSGRGLQKSDLLIAKSWMHPISFKSCLSMNVCHSNIALTHLLHQFFYVRSSFINQVTLHVLTRKIKSITMQLTQTRK